MNYTSLQKEEFKEDPDFLEFFEANSAWLVPYAAFCYLRDKHQTPISRPGPSTATIMPTAIREYTAPGTPAL
jgi:4-alpha-glucanotransferase